MLVVSFLGRRGYPGTPPAQSHSHLGAKIVGVDGCGEQDDGAVIGGLVDESQGQDAETRHFLCIVLPKK